MGVYGSPTPSPGVIQKRLWNTPALMVWRRLATSGALNDGTIHRELSDLGIDAVLHHGQLDGDVLVVFDPSGNSLMSGAKPTKAESRLVLEKDL